MQPTNTEYAWAAGIFEGEGTIGWNKTRHYPNLGLITTDEDVIDRFHEIVQAGHVYKNRKITGLGSKQQYIWNAGSIGDVRHVAKTVLLPWMGRRRRARLLEVLDLFNTSPIVRKPRSANRTHCPQGHPYDEANTHIDPRGHRHCRECNRRAQNPHYETRQHPYVSKPRQKVAA